MISLKKELGKTILGDFKSPKNAFSPASEFSQETLHDKSGCFLPQVIAVFCGLQSILKGITYLLIQTGKDNGNRGCCKLKRPTPMKNVE